MQSITEIMTQDVAVLSPQDTLTHAAQMMRDRDIGALPVCDGQRLLGMLTDRDITVRAVATGRPPEDIRVSEIMSNEVLWCFEDQTADDVLQQMGDKQVRRIPVVSRDMNLVGIVALADLVTRTNTDIDTTLEDISMPSEPNRSSADELRARQTGSTHPGQGA